MRLAINQPFDLETSLMMGQAFRWHQLDAGFYPDGSDERPWFSGVLGDNLIHIRQTEDGVEYRSGGPNGATDADLNDLLSRYFRLDDDIEAIYAYLCERDPRMEKLVENYRGMRLLRQDPWECLVSYICSATASIKQISTIVESLARAFGDPVSLNGETRYTFPDSGVLSLASEGELRQLMLGFRAPRVIRAAKQVASGSLDLRRLTQSNVSSAEAVRVLLAVDGVGLKVASCVAMMSLNKTDAFPVDRWILRALVAGNYADCPIPRKRLHDSAHKRIISWAQSYFGPYAGYAGQYLFHGIEPNK